MKKITSVLSLLTITGMLLSTVLIQSCSKSSSTTPAVVLIGGYATSDSVAASNLIAYWPFDGNANDAKGGLTAVSNGITYNTGIRGQAYQGSSSSYATLAVPSGSPFASLNSFSISVWFNLPALPVAGDPGGMFFLSGTNTLNEMILEADVPSTSQKTTDSVKIHHGFTDLGSPGWQGFTLESYDTMALARWVHLVMTYDGGSSTYTYYQNGIPTGVSSAWSNGQYVTPTTMYDGPLPLGSGTPATTTLGNISFSTDAPKQIVLGTWPATLYGVSPTLGANGCFLGQLDELRVFNKALLASEVAGLYLNGKAGR